MLALDGTLPPPRVEPTGPVYDIESDCPDELVFRGREYDGSGTQVVPLAGAPLPEPAHRGCGEPEITAQPVAVAELVGVSPDVAIVREIEGGVQLYLRDDVDHRHLPPEVERLVHAPPCDPADEPIELVATWRAVTGLDDESTDDPEPPYTLHVRALESRPAGYERADLELVVPTAAGRPVKRSDVFDYLWTGGTLAATVGCDGGAYLVRTLRMLAPGEIEP